MGVWRAVAGGRVRRTGLLLVAVLVGGLTTGATPAAAAGWSVSLTGALVGGDLSLTATANQNVDGSGYSITIWDRTTGAWVGSCGGTTCTAKTVPFGSTSTLSAAAHDYVATISSGNASYPPTVVAAESPAWTAPRWNIALNPPSYEAGVLTWTATMNYNVDPAHYRVVLWDTTANRLEANCSPPDGVLSCQWTPQVPQGDTTATSMGPHTYVATVGAGNTSYPPTNLAAKSQERTVPAWDIDVTSAVVETGTQLTATANYLPKWSAYGIVFYDLTDGQFQPSLSCIEDGGEGRCSVIVREPGHVYVATVATARTGSIADWPPDDIAAVSDMVDASGAAMGPLNPLEAIGGGNPAELNDGQAAAAEPVDVASGAYWATATDVSVSGRGVPLAFGRTYDSRRAAESGRLGFGWIDSYDWLLTENATTGEVTVRHGNGSRSLFTPVGGGRYTHPSRVLADLVHRADGTWSYTIRQRTVYTFASSGKLTRITDLNGYATALGYDGSGRLATVTDPANRTLTIGYDASNRIHTVTDPLPRTVTYTYDADGNLDTVTDVDGRLTKFDYQGHLLTTVTDPRNSTLVNTYVSGRVSQQQDWRGRNTTFTYSGTAANGTTTVTLPRGNKDVYTIVNGLRTQVVRGSGTADAATDKFEFDTLTNGVTKHTDGLNHATTSTYDADGNELTRKDALNRRTTWTYDAFGDPLTMTDPSNVTTTYTYDDHGNPATVSRPLVETGETATYVFTYGDTAHPGDATKVTDPSGKSTWFGYDTYGNRTSATDATDRRTSWTFNVVGWLTSETTPAGNASGGVPSEHVTTFSNFTGFGSPRTVTDPTGHAATYGYDANQNLTDVTDAESRHTQMTYNNSNQQTVLTRPDATLVKTGYDDNGNLYSQRDGLNHVAATYGFDSLDRLTSVTDALGRVTTITYDKASNQKTAVADSKTITFGYNNGDELTSLTYSDGTTPNVSFTYDALGRRKTMVDGTGTSTYTYDSLGRMRAVTTGTGKSVGYGYGLRDDLTSITYPNGQQVVRRFDDAGRLRGITDWLGNATAFEYDADGNLGRTTYPNGVVGTIGRDSVGRPMSIGYAKGATGLGSYTYTRTPGGRLKTATPSAGAPGTAATYAYTTNAQLKSTAGPSASAIWSYDAADRITKNPQGTTFGYDNADQLASGTVSGGAAISTAYDARGNRTQYKVGTSGASNNYSWDQAGRLTLYKRVSSGGSGSFSTTFAYTGDGLRATKKGPGDTTAKVSVWDEATTGPALLLTDGTSSFVYGPDGVPVEQITGTVPTYLHQDQLGSTALITDASGAVTGKYAYDPYGKATFTGTTSTPLQFNGQYTDAESGLVHLRARYYDPDTGQFLSVDPLVGGSRSRYGYAQDDPLTFTDPSGLLAIAVCYNHSQPFASFIGGLNLCAGVVGGEFTTLVTGSGNIGIPSSGNTGGILFSNASSPEQLGGWFGELGMSGGVGPLTVGDEYGHGIDSCNRYVWTNQVMVGPEFTPLALLDGVNYEIHGGASWTWAHGWFSF